MAAEKYDAPEHLNVGTGEDVTIAELAKTVASESGFTGEIKWDLSKPDGTIRKVLDVTNIKKVGWAPEIPLKEGIASTIEWFKENENRLVKRY
jgi:GDP-L-fucose synthase